MKNINKQLVELPDGNYDALWSAYRMKILIPNKESVYVETVIGIKGINCEIKVEIKDKLLSTIS